MCKDTEPEAYRQLNKLDCLYKFPLHSQTNAWCPCSYINYRIYNMGIYLLSPLCSGSHFLTEGKVRHFEVGDGIDTNIKNGQKGDHGGNSHEQAW
jgi:hypothetical protein